MDKLTILLLVFVSVVFADFNFEDEDLSDVVEAEVEDDQIWSIPQLDGTFKLMTEQEAKDLTIKSEIIERYKLFFKNKQKKIRFFLHTQKNVMKWQEVDMERSETLQRSNFNSSHPTRSV